MPSLANADIRDRIADGRICGISVDTDIFERYGCNLDYITLQRLDQFQHGNVQFYLSEVVVREITSHIFHDAAETQRKLKQAITKQSKRWRQPIDLEALREILCLGTDPNDAADRQIRDYISSVGAIIVPASGLHDVSREVLRRYFGSEPPFGHTEKRKHEFPDAFALLTIEAVAAEGARNILCVSKDKGWVDFAARSEHLICVDNLTTALSLFNDAGRTTADQAMALWRDGQATSLQTAVENEFECRLSYNDYLLEAYSNCSLDIDPIGAGMLSVDLDSATSPVVIAADDEKVTFVVSLPALVEYEANVSFYAYDGVDKDYLYLTTETFSTTQTDNFQVAITVGREMEHELQVHSVDIAKQDHSINLGPVEPFLNENPNLEKY